MFTFDAFGNRVLCRPRLMFNGAGGGGGGGSEEDTRTPQEQGYDFPAETAVKDMTVEQEKEYHRYHSKKHESRAKRLERDRPQLEADAAELARLRAGNQTDADRAQAEALDEARREGENIGSQKYLGVAVKANFRASTGKTAEEVDAIFAHIDVTSFLDDDGEIDHARLDAFAASTGGTPTGGAKPPVTDPLKNALDRQRQAGGAGSGKSMKERREETRDSLTKKK